jgi:hypothetical protein
VTFSELARTLEADRRVKSGWEFATGAFGGLFQA